MNGVINYQNYYNMELMFNELSLEPLSNNKYDGIEKAKHFASTFAVARTKGFERIRSVYHYSEIKLSADYSLQDFLFEKAIELKNYKDILFGNINQPFINEDDGEVADNYIMSNFHFNNNGTKQACLGLTAAFLYDTLSISLNSSTLWKNNTLPIINVVDKVSKTEQVNNVFSKDCFVVQSISDFVENLGDLDLQETDISPNNKSITLFGDHHGKEYLQALADKLINSPFVIEIRSIKFGGNSFIRKIHTNGVLEVVVMKRDERFALWVQTTGRNFRETKAIAEKLREQYS